MDRRAVLRNQRRRIQGALAETVARDGWERTSVARVIRLAGVSRRAFYEQFANREHCLLATCEESAARCLAEARTAAAAAACGRRPAVQAIADAVAQAVERSHAEAALAVCHLETAGPAGVACARRSALAWERMLAQSLWPNGVTAPPDPVLRALVGGAHAIVREHLGADAPGAPADRARALRPQLLGWAAPLVEPIPAGLPTRAASSPAGSSSGRARAVRAVPGVRAPRHERLLCSVLRLAVLAHFTELTAARIADEARVPVEAFFAHFADPAACYAAAQERLGADLLAALDHATAGEDWPTAVRIRIGLLLSHLHARPLCAHTLARGAFGAGPAAVRRNHSLAATVAARVLAGATGTREEALAATAGALWHTIGCHVACAGVQLLPSLRDPLAYVVIAPVSGADVAARTVAPGSP